MKLRMLIPMSGPEYALSIGDERDFPEGEARRLIEAGYAEAAEDKAKTSAPAKKAGK